MDISKVHLEFLQKKEKNNYSKVIFTIFAGRECYLSILFKYLDYLLQKNIIDVVHLWNYTKNSNDERYLQDWCNNNDKYILIIPETKYGWLSYYKYYLSNNFDDNDIIIKCDDDIVYIDIDRMKEYLDEINEDYLYFPNIINNDVCALIQSKYNVNDFIINKSNEVCKCWPEHETPHFYNNYLELSAKPMCEWFRCYNRAGMIHKDFLSDISKYTIENINNIKWGYRMSINFFGARHSYLKKIYSKFVAEGCGDDEGYLSGVYPIKMKTYNIIIPFFTVSHFSFRKQNEVYLKKEYLYKYSELVNKITCLNIY